MISRKQGNVVNPEKHWMGLPMILFCKLVWYRTCYITTVVTGRERECFCWFYFQFDNTTKHAGRGHIFNQYCWRVKGTKVWKTPKYPCRYHINSSSFLGFAETILAWFRLTDITRLHNHYINRRGRLPPIRRLHYLYRPAHEYLSPKISLSLTRLGKGHTTPQQRSIH